jgi:hypothetical protein
VYFYIFQDVTDDPTFFLTTIEPFMPVWQKLRLSGVAVRKNEKWISLSTRLALSHEYPEPEFVIRPTDDFIGFAKDVLLGGLHDLLDSICSNGVYSLQVEDRICEIFLSLAHARSDPRPNNIISGPPYSTIGQIHERCLEIGDSCYRLANSNVEHQYQIVDYDELSRISSKLRLHTPAFNGIPELLVALKAPFEKNNNQTSIEVVAPLPFSIKCSGTEVTVSAPYGCAKQLRVIGFFDTGQATVELTAVTEHVSAPFAEVAGAIPWPKDAHSGKLFLYFNNDEVGSVVVHRWSGTTNWRVQVQGYFDPGAAILKKGLQARKQQTQFELATVRLLDELQIPAPWYGDHQYQDRSDLAACLELGKQRIVILGECTVQKPSDKFTLLLTRKKELENLLQGEIRVLPVVFTSTTLSSADKHQAREDGISLVGADEITTLVKGVEQGWGQHNVVAFLEQLLVEPLFDTPLRWQS